MRFKKITVRAVYCEKHLLTSLGVKKRERWNVSENIKLMMNRCIFDAPFCAHWKLVSLDRKRNNRSKQQRTRGAITHEIVIRRDARYKNKSLTFMGGALSETSLSLAFRPRMINNCRSRWLRIASNRCTIPGSCKPFMIIFFGSRSAMQSISRRLRRIDAPT